MLQKRLSNAHNRFRADDIIGLSVDIDEISGKRSQLFMITAVGAPVHLKEAIRAPIEKRDDVLDGELIQQKVTADIILENYKSIEYISKETAEFIATSGEASRLKGVSLIKYELFS